ncbi:hypothetical protein Vretimale_15637 [Volvox reticuliferus]|uniref:Glucosidase II subunit alpha n=1 Tax=Volvox reticuliferus TaxID=1737510 RepID=A0A8J4CSL7_9CHLO|nr:hypothetical protein Vretifemale_15011 [Volvox reticuliferus]GIM12254.1 hypothetical protein Vretimale_15637 [Volvox reticuliferus]
MIIRLGLPDRAMRAAIASLLLAVLAISQRATAFKENEFKKCAQTSFCSRNRNVQQGANFDIVPASIVLNTATITGTLLNKAFDKHLQLTVTSHADGFVRVMVDESPSVGRYQVPSDVLVSGWENKKQGFKEESRTSASITLSTGETKLVLNFQPFSLAISIKGVPALQINSRNLFNFEHRRQKQESDPAGYWEESWMGHTDSKPKGPEAISLDLVFPGFNHVYGIPERATSLSLRSTNGAAPYGEPYRLYNLDVFEYLDDHPFGLYGSIPMMLAHKKGLTVGVFWLNAAEMFVDVVKTRSDVGTQWVAESGIVDLFVFTGGSAPAVLSSYARVAGTTALPQLFALGYHQCRWNYKDEVDVKMVDAGFDSHEIPYDVLWLDIEHTNGKRYLTWDSSLFPRPVEMQEDLASRGREMVTIVDPHVKRDSSYYIFSEAEKAGHFVKNKHGSDFDGWCWPGSSSYLDVTSPVVREWWAQQFTLDKYKGSTKHLYIWNDMNEPSVFNGPEITMQKDNLHYGNVEHRDNHNLFGIYYHMGTAEGLKLRGSQVDPENGDRPFVLSRAFFSGTQRVGPIWTGDNAAQWSHLKVAVPMLLTLGLTGLPYSGADVGGFFGNPDAELMTRWYQVGIYYPFFRGHAHLETQRREPWLFGEDTTTRIRTAIRGRYILLPYIYTLFRFANTSGLPILRPLWYEFPDNEDLFAVEEEFMVGSAMLVKPIVAPGVSSVDVTLPAGARWYDALSGAVVPARTRSQRVQVTLDAIPVYYRGGSIVPLRERPRRSSAAQAADPYTLIVALDEKGEASGSLYVDDGRSFAFQQGRYLHRDFTFKSLKLSSTVHAELGVPNGTLTVPTTIDRVVFLGLPSSKRGYKALIGGKHAALLETGPLTMLAPQHENAVVLRKPGLPVSYDWQVEIVAL